DPSDTRTAHSPDIPVSLRYADYVAGRDPAMEAILKHVPVQIPPTNIPSDSWRPLCGRYRWSFERALEIAASRGGVLMKVTDYFQTCVYPLSPKKFVTDIPGMELQIVKEEQGEATQILYKTRGYQKLIDRLAADTQTPSEFFQAGKYDEAIDL